MSDVILVEQLAPGVVSLMMNRPERRNALSVELLESLTAELERLDHNRGNRVCILRGASPVFTAGLDLHEALDESLINRSAEGIRQILDRIQETPLIMIAAVEGGAFGGGAGVMAACDIVIAADDAKIGFPEARHGLLPALICDVLRYRVREGDLRDLLLAGEPIDAARAQVVGLVQRIVPKEQLLDEALRVARLVSEGGPETIRLTKALLNKTFHHIGPGSDYMQSHLVTRRSDEAREGLAAYGEKRKPSWQ